MATFSTSEFKNGLKVLIDGEPCSILENEVVKPGKGQAFNRVRMRNLKNGRVWERTYKSGESLEGADVMETDMQYLYSDGEFWHFMKTDDSFEQIADRNRAVDCYYIPEHINFESFVNTLNSKKFLSFLSSVCYNNYQTFNKNFKKKVFNKNNHLVLDSINKLQYIRTNYAGIKIKQLGNINKYESSISFSN